MCSPKNVLKTFVPYYYSISNLTKLIKLNSEKNLMEKFDEGARKTRTKMQCKLCARTLQASHFQLHDVDC